MRFLFLKNKFITFLSICDEGDLKNQFLENLSGQIFLNPLENTLSDFGTLTPIIEEKIVKSPLFENTTYLYLRGVGTELGQNDENRFLTLSTYSNGPEPP